MHGRPTENQSGQAILEYVLLLVIVIAIIGGILYKFNDAFAKYSNAWFVGPDSYLACIIKNGILPDGESDASVDCTKPPFNLASGKELPLSANAGGGSGSSNPNSPNNKNSRATSSSSSVGGSGDRGSSQSGLLPYGAAGSKKSGADAAAKTPSKESTGNNGFSTATGQGGQDGLGGNGSGEIPISSGRKGSLKEESSREKAATSVPVTTRDMKSAREIAAEKAKKKAKASDDTSMDFSFSNIIKLLLIAALIFGIIFFVGSQVLAVSRSKNRK